ncbi:hypothetical protein TW65_07439 [Stemphylium lycopersici]|uniref:Glycine-rich cell wall structural protein 1 n=1 Tax=Stemphylium lycopersici TaxID=183478 RepID=A0A364MT89_STELY|nr:hypothetical protein TW65_07439 [Stemphylium lycopersici]RAR02681.1 glycine-rich cell wall structural protein 1 [Stemphylium lycopersici]
METITNLATNATTAASKLIYGDQTKTDEAVAQTQNNETAGKEPISGETGQGTATQPYDQGNLATPLATADKGTFLDYSNNETAVKEPASGVLGKGTVTEPFDQGNDAKAADLPKDPVTGSGIQDEFLKLDPVSQGPTETTTSDPKIYSDRTDDPSYAGMPIVPLNPDANVLGTGATPSATATTTTTTTTTTAPETTGITDKVWKDNPLDDISRSGAPGAGPTPPSHVTPAAPESAATTTTATTSPDPAVKTSAPDSVTASSGLYSVDKTQKSETTTHAQRESENRDTPAWTDTGVASDSSKFEEDTARQNRANPKDVKNAIEEETGRKSESTDLGSSPSNEEKSGKMSHLKEKMKNKLHIGSKDK